MLKVLEKTYEVILAEMEALPLFVHPTSNGLFVIPPPRLDPIHPADAGAVKIPMNSLVGGEGKRYPKPVSNV